MEHVTDLGVISHIIYILWADFINTQSIGTTKLNHK